MGADKVWLPLGAMPVVAYSLRAFVSHASRLVLVVSQDRLMDARALLRELGILATVCEGGERRQDSVLQGLTALGDIELVAIHDGARPLVSNNLIQACYETAEREDAAIAAIPVRDTVKRVTLDGHIAGTIDRDALWVAQTPQVFRARLLRQAYESLGEEVTDDAEAMERLGYRVKIVPGDAYNLKLTTQDDLAVARALVGRRGFGEVLQGG
jgi:2-C-methyl-D-erythritol 4-phosphate cytidylyltransferase